MKFVNIGHVDTGKSSLCGILLYQSGFISEHDMTKIKIKAASEGMTNCIWSRILDIYEEENKGNTYDFSEIDFKLNNKIYTLVDTPGHQLFVRSMISGIVRNVNVAVLLVSVAENEFESGFERGMLKEHTILARAVGIEYLIVAFNKMDLINWDEKIYLSRVDSIKKFTSKIWASDKIKFIPISAYNNIGITSTIGYPDWYTGPSFIGLLDEVPVKNTNLLNNVIKTDQINIQLKILNVKNIISKGFECIAHITNNEYDIEIIEMNKQIGRVGDVLKCVLKFKNVVEIYTNSRIILRKDNHTIGFGKVDF